MSVQYAYWQNKKTGEIFAVRTRGGRPDRFCGPLENCAVRGPNGQLLDLKLSRYHYGLSFTDDPYNYLLCD